MEAQSLEGRVAIITGAGRGIGRSVALKLANHGAKTSLASRTKAELESVRAEIEAFGGEAICLPTDVSSESEAIALVQQTVDHYGFLDMLINNAGVGGHGAWEDTTTEAWDRVMAVNARGPFVLCREASPHIRRRGGGHIINVLSIGGIRCYKGYNTYSVSKNALRALTVTLSKELREHNIRVHAVSMGGVDTVLMRQGLHRRPDIDVSQLIQPEEIADIVLFLVSWPGTGVIDEIRIRRPDAPYWA